MHHNEVVRIAQQAWDKTKPASDPIWNDCDAHHRQVFIATADAVINSGHAVNDFEHVVKKLANDAEEKQKAVAEVQVKNPTAHSDELQAIAAAKAEGKPDVPQINPPSSESEASSSEKTSATRRKTKARPKVKSPKKGK